MAKRKPLSKKLRFEVFKRDSFKCQYCGKSSPDVTLHVDHIHPVSKGGDNDILNLITSCQSCNAGKSDRTLDDNTSIQKQRKQLEELNERREQLEMMLQWREGMESIVEDAKAALVKRINGRLNGRRMNDAGESLVKQWLRKFSVAELFDALDSASNKIAVNTLEDADALINLIPKIAAMNRKPEGERRLYYIRGILRNRIYVNEASVMGLMRDALSASNDIDRIEQAAKGAPNWSVFKSQMEDMIYG